MSEFQNPNQKVVLNVSPTALATNVLPRGTGYRVIQPEGDQAVEPNGVLGRAALVTALQKARAFKLRNNKSDDVVLPPTMFQYEPNRNAEQYQVDKKYLYENEYPFVRQLGTSNLEKFSKIEQEADRILEELEIKPSANPDDQMKIAYKLFAYVVQNSSFNENRIVVNDGSKNYMEEVIEEVYKLLVEEHQSACVGDAETLGFLLRRAGVDANALYIDSEKTTHATTLMKVGETMYILDATVTRQRIELGKISDPSGRFTFGLEEYINAYNEARPIDDISKNAPFEPPLQEYLQRYPLREQ